MAALGDAFRTAREAQGLTLSDVAQTTHIRSSYLMAIESEDWKVIGPAVYIRGFLRAYARCLGLDPDAAVSAYTGEPVAKAPPPVYTHAPTKPAAAWPQPARGDKAGATLSTSAPARKRPSAGAIAGLIVALGLVLFVGYEFVDYKLSQPVALNEATATASPLATSSAAVTSAATAQPVEPSPGLERRTSASTGEVSATRSLEVETNGFELRLADASWLRVVVDGKVALEGIYPKGTERRFSGRSATVRVGNAGGVDISVDGKDLGPMGGLGDVAERSFQL